MTIEPGEDKVVRDQETARYWLGEDYMTKLGPKGIALFSELLAKTNAKDGARDVLSDRVLAIAETLRQTADAMDAAGVKGGKPDGKVSAAEVRSFNAARGTAFKEQDFTSHANFVSLNLHDELKRIADTIKDSNANHTFDKAEVNKAQPVGGPIKSAKPVQSR